MLKKILKEMDQYSRLFYHHVALPYLLWLGLEMFLLLILVLSQLSALDNMTAMKEISESTKQFNQQNLAINFHAIKMMFFGLLGIPFGGVVVRGIFYGIDYYGKIRKENRL